MTINVNYNVYQYLITGEYFRDLDQCYKKAVEDTQNYLATYRFDERKYCAAIIDIDETILCSVGHISLAPYCKMSRYIGDVIIEETSRREQNSIIQRYRDSMYIYDSKIYPALPGAIEFCDKISELVRGNVFFVTGRDYRVRETTLFNLDYYNLQYKDVFMNSYYNTVPVGEFKDNIRNHIKALDYDIVLSIGDRKTDLGHQCAINRLVNNPFY